MLQSLFHAWERRLAARARDRVVRPFDWGLDWIPDNGHAPGTRPAQVIGDWVSHVMADTDAFFTPPPTTAYTLRPAPDGDLLTFPSAFDTPHDANNTVYCRYFPAAAPLKRRPTYEETERRLTSASSVGRRFSGAPSKAAVLVLPQWNSDPGGHVGLCKLLAWKGISALRLSLPFHDQRVQVCRQAVLDARRAIAWLATQGYDRIGILGTSLGSCLALLTTAHEPLINAQALNHISPHFADVVWRGLSTRHVREGLEGHIDLDVLRTLWRPISPRWYLDRLRDRRTLLVYARYDLTFPVDLSQDLVRAFRELGVPHEVAELRCGQYSTGKTPFKFVDGWILTRFLKKALVQPWNLRDT